MASEAEQGKRLAQLERETKKLRAEVERLTARVKSLEDKKPEAPVILDLDGGGA